MKLSICPSRRRFFPLLLGCLVTSACETTVVGVGAGTIVVTVTLDGSPAVGMPVEVYLQTNTGRPNYTGGTTGAGSLVFNSVAAGQWRVIISPPDLVTCDRVSADVVVQADQPSPANFACIGKGDVAGRVTVNGSPEGGVAVELRHAGGVAGTTSTTSNGAYAFESVTAGLYTVVITPPSLATCPTVQQQVRVAGDSIATADFACTRPTTGAIVVLVTSSGSPVPGAAVTIATSTFTSSGTTSSSGTAQFNEVPPGSYGVVAVASGQHCTPQVASVTIGTTTNVTVPCVANGTAFGLVTLDGQPAADVLVSISPASDSITVPIIERTSSSGTFIFENRPPGSYVIVVFPPTGATCDKTIQTITVASGQTTIVPEFACTSATGPTVPTGVQIAGNWTYTRVFVSESGACGAQLGGSGAGSMTFNPNNNVIFATGFDPDHGQSGPYNQTTGGWTGTGTRIFSGGITLQTTVTGNFALSISANPTFGGVMTQRYTGNNDCQRVYNVSGVRGN